MHKPLTRGAHPPQNLTKSWRAISSHEPLGATHSSWHKTSTVSNPQLPNDLRLLSALLSDTTLATSFAASITLFAWGVTLPRFGDWYCACAG